MTTADLPDTRAVPQRAVLMSLEPMPKNLNARGVLETSILEKREVTVFDFYRGRPEKERNTQCHST